MQGSDSLFTRARRRRELFKSHAVNSLGDSLSVEARYEMEDTSMVHEMADTSIRAANSEAESASDEDYIG